MRYNIIYVIVILITTATFIAGIILRIENYLWYRRAVKDSIHISNTKNSYLKKIDLKYTNMKKLGALCEDTYIYAKRNVDKIDFLDRQEKILRCIIILLGYETVISGILSGYRAMILSLTYLFITLIIRVILDSSYQRRMLVYSVSEALSMSKSGRENDIPVQRTDSRAETPVSVNLTAEEAKIVEDIMEEFFT